VLPDRCVADDGCNNHGDGDIGSWRSVQPAAAAVAATNRFFSPPRHRRAADEAARRWSIRADWSPPWLRSRAIQDAAYAPIDAYTGDTDVGDYVRRAAADL